MGDDGYATNLFEEDHYDDDGAMPESPASSTLTGAAAHLKDAFVLYAMAEESPECRRKISCVFGSAARRSTSVVSPSVVGRLLRMATTFLGSSGGGGARSSSSGGVAVLEELAREFEGDREQEDCSLLDCSKCFGV